MFPERKKKKENSKGNYFSSSALEFDHIENKILYFEDVPRSVLVSR